jgi:hypothetical protein
MRFAGQRFRSPKQRMGRFTAEDGAFGDVAYPVQIQGLAPSRAAMPEWNVASFVKTGEPEFRAVEIYEPIFEA